MKITLLELLGRQCDINSLCFIARLLLGCLELCIHCIELFCSPVPDLIDHLAVIGLKLFRDLAHLLHERADLTFLGVHNALSVLKNAL